MMEVARSSSSMYTVTAATVAALTATILWLKMKKSGMERRVATPPVPGIPLTPGGHWLLGHLAMMQEGGFEKGNKNVMQDYADPQTGLCSSYNVSSPAVSVLYGTDGKLVLNSSSSKPTFKFVHNHLRKFLGYRSLLALKGAEWRNYRRVIHRSFTPAVIQQSQDSIYEVGMTLVHSLLEAIDTSPSLSLHKIVLPLMKMATMDVFGKVGLNVDFQSCAHLRKSQIAEAFEFLNADCGRRLKSPFDPAASWYGIPTASNKAYAHHQTVIQSFIHKQIEKTRAQQVEGKATKNHDLLSNLIEATALEGGSDKEIYEVVTDMLTTLLFGGHDTSSVTLSYGLYLLAKNPEVQEKCVAEVKNVLSSGKKIDKPAEQLPYTNAVMLETLRIFSPVSATSRTLEKDITLHGITLKKGLDVVVPVWLIQRHEKNFPKPLEMLPDRWVRQRKDGAWEARPSDDLSSSEIQPGNKDAILAFSAGARNCVGKTLAIQEIVTLFACLVSKLKFELVEPSYEVKPVMTFLLQPEDELPMIIKKR